MTQSLPVRLFIVVLLCLLIAACGNAGNQLPLEQTAMPQMQRGSDSGGGGDSGM